LLQPKVDPAKAKRVKTLAVLNWARYKFTFNFLFEKDISAALFDRNDLQLQQNFIKHFISNPKNKIDVSLSRRD
jgi:hypothetical protein